MQQLTELQKFQMRHPERRADTARHELGDIATEPESEDTVKQRPSRYRPPEPEYGRPL